MNNLVMPGPDRTSRRTRLDRQSIQSDQIICFDKGVTASLYELDMK